MTHMEILPGARVRTATGIIGSVERVETPGVDDATPGSLLVRATDSARRYSFPLRLVEGVGEEFTQSVAHTLVRLALDPADLDRYVVQDDEGHDTVASPGATQAVASTGSEQDAGETLRVPVFAEELTVETRPVRRGTVRLHKGVETVEQRLTTTLTHEEVIVERIPAEQYDASAPVGPGETIIPVVEERLVVETRAVVVEYIRLHTRRVTEQQEVRAPVRREVVTIQELRVDDAAVTDSPLYRDVVDVARGGDTRS